MRKLSISFLICLVCFLHVRSNGQEPAATIQITKTELFSFKDIKPILAIAFPDKNYESFEVLRFNITGTADISVSFAESADGGKLTEKQRSLIDKYGKQGTSFALESIILMKHGVPGTLYNPTDEITISVPTILLSIKE